VFYGIKPTGELLWYHDLQRDGTNLPNGTAGWAENSGSQIGTEWFVYPSELRPSLQFDFNQVTFKDSTPVGGNAHLTLRSDGSFTVWGHAHNSGAIDYNISMMIVVKDSNDQAYYPTQVSASLSGSPGSNSRDFDFRGDSQDESIRANWPRIVARSAAWCTIDANSNAASLVGLALGTVGVVLAVIALPVVWAVIAPGKAEGSKPLGPTAVPNPAPTPELPIGGPTSGSGTGDGLPPGTI